MVTMTLVGAEGASRVVGRHRLATTSHYIFGADPRSWRRDVPHFDEVAFEGAYPGIDFICRGGAAGLRYDFIVAPGADASRVRLAFGGVDGVTIDDRGDLVLEVGGRDLRHTRPVIYQERSGLRVPVEGRFTRLGTRVVGFDIRAYDQSLALVIDPTIHVAYSTYLGGLRTDVGNAVAVDGAGNTYVVGRTESDDFPTVGGPSARRGGRDIFIAKISEDGSEIVYSTYLGGSADENPLDRG